MAMYESFAHAYDTFMDEVPYDAWAEHLVERLRQAGIDDGLVLDLGCGTGAMTQRLSEAGYDMIGVDSSADMLQIAQEKKFSSGLDILYLLQDMREFELYGTVRAVICCCDSLNYLTEEEDLLTVFRLVNNYLDPDGLFLFDMKTAHHYRDELGDQIFADSRPECSYIWENAWYEEEQINEYALTLFLQEEDGRYRRYEEVHTERAYEAERIRELLSEAGLRTEGLYDDYSMRPGKADSRRLLFAAREYQKVMQKQQT